MTTSIGNHHQDDPRAFGALVVATMISTMPVTSAPKPLIAALVRQPGVRSVPPVDDHPGLRQRERHEDADHVERNQRVRVAAEDDQQHAPRARCRIDDAVGEREAVALVHELPRQESIARDDRRQPREVRIGRIRRQHQDQHRRGLHGVVQAAAAAEGRRARSATRPSRLSLGMMPYACASSVMPMNMVIDSTAIVDQRRCGVPALRRTERRHAVRDRFDAGHRRAAVGEGRQQHERGRAMPPCSSGSARPAAAATGASVPVT